MFLRHPLDGALLKLQRAKKHLADLKAEMRGFFDLKPYSVSIEPQAQPGQFVAFAHVHHPIPPTLPLIIGDTVHNLRSVLDHLVWELSMQFHRASPHVVAPPGKKTEFPILADLPADRNSRAFFEGKIKSLPAEVGTIIQGLQPYEIDPKQPESTPLWILHDLDRWDKHKRIPLTLATFSDLVCSLTDINGHTAYGRVAKNAYVLPDNVYLPFEEGAKLATIETYGYDSSTGVGGLPPVPIVKVEVRVKPEVAFALDTAANRKAVVPTTESCVVLVESIVAALRQFFPKTKSEFET